MADIGEEIGFERLAISADSLARTGRLAVLQVGDVGADADGRAIGGAMVADLDPASIAQLHVEGCERLGADPQAVLRPGVVLAFRYDDLAGGERQRNEISKRNAGDDAIAMRGRSRGTCCCHRTSRSVDRTAQSFRDAPDRVRQLGLQPHGTLRRLGLLGNVACGAAEAEEVAVAAAKTGRAKSESAPRAVAMGDRRGRSRNGLRACESKGLCVSPP